MGRHWTIDGVDVPLTPQEEIDLDAEWALYDAGIPMRDWKESMQGTDSGMPRYMEDIFNRDGTDGLPQVLIDKYNTKKDLRATKP